MFLEYHFLIYRYRKPVLLFSNTRDNTSLLAADPCFSITEANGERSTLVTAMYLRTYL